jgi:hypothetical protein
VMFLIKRTTVLLAACLVLCCHLTLSSFADKPDRNGGGGGNGGGGDPPPSLPVDLDVRYRVQFIPLPDTASNYVVHDVNEAYEAVGAYNDVNGLRVGYYYDTLSETVQTAGEMITLPERWVSTSFVGINNSGVIVGMVQDILGFSQCLVVFPHQGGYSYEITSPVDESGAMDSHFTKINDYGDIVGISWDDNGVGFAFAYNPGLFAPAAPFQFFGSPGAAWNAMQVTNTRLGAVRWGGEMSWFDFSTKEQSLVQFPANERQPTGWGLSNDGQITVTEALVQKKGRNISYRYTPGIMVLGQYVWQGNLDDGYATLVNSAVGSNPVGDVIGFNEISRVRWLRHANHPEWGYLDLGAMVVFSSADDEQRWLSIPGPGVRVWGMSDRDPATGFGLLTGQYSGFDTEAAYVLIPEFVVTDP